MCRSVVEEEAKWAQLHWVVDFPMDILARAKLATDLSDLAIFAKAILAEDVFAKDTVATDIFATDTFASYCVVRQLPPSDCFSKCDES